MATNFWMEFRGATMDKEEDCNKKIGLTQSSILR